MLNILNALISIIANIISILRSNINFKKLSLKLESKKVNVIIISISIIFVGLIFVVHYYSSIYVTQVLINEDSMEINPGKSEELTAKVLFSNNSIGNDVLWVSNNDSIATIDSNGLVTALKEGNVTITAQASKNNTVQSAKCNITVIKSLEGYDITVKNTIIGSYFYIYVVPHNENNNVNIKLHAKSPSGTIYTCNKAKNDLYYFYAECGTWTVYASIEDDDSVYYANQPEDFAIIEVTTTDEIDNLFELSEIYNS